MSQADLQLYDLLSSILYIAGFIFSVHHLCRCFTRNKAREKFLTPLVFASLGAIDLFALTGILPYPVTTLLYQTLTLLWIIMIYQGETAPKISAAVIAITMVELAYDFLAALLMCLELVFLHTVRHDPAPLISPVSGCVIILISSIFVIMSVRALSTHMNALFKSHTARWYTMLTAPLLCIMLLWNAYGTGACYGIMLRGEDDWNLYINQLFSYIGNCVLAMLCMCGAGFYLFGMMKIDLEQKKKEQYHSQIMFYRMLSEQYTAQERLRHDMKNHIIALRQLIADQEWVKLEEYLCQMAQTGALEQPEDVTGSRIVDALLYDKHKRALQNHIRWECDVHIPPDCSVDDFDLCVIFGNIIDNALEACKNIPCISANEEPDKYIQMHCHPIKKFLLLEVVNTACNDNSQTHPTDGIGLMNVRETVNKYNGTLEIDIKDHTYRISILLPVIRLKNHADTLIF